MARLIIEYATPGMVTAMMLSEKLFAPWHAIEYTLDELRAAGLLEGASGFYSLTDKGRKYAASPTDETDQAQS